MKHVLRLTFSVDRDHSGLSVNAQMDDDHYDSRGWDDDPPGSLNDDWFDLLQILYPLPKAVEAAGRSWDDAEVKTYGYCPGVGHTQDGIIVEWTWPDPESESAEEARYQREWQREIAMEAGMGLGVDAFNEVMGYDEGDDE